jgi:hypothetical protein
MFRQLACLTLAIAFSCSGSPAQKTAPRETGPLRASTAQEIDPAIAGRLPKGTKVHVLTEDEFGKLLAKLPPVALNVKESPAVANPSASAQESSILAELAKQKLQADSDALQIKTRPTGALLSPRAQVTMTQAPALNPNLRGRGARSTASKYARLQTPNNALTGCYAIARGQMVIGNVTGQTKKLIFTPLSQYNLYIVHGCNFGDNKLGRKAWIYGLGFHVDFQIETWTDDAIVMKLPENLSGVLDQDSLHLVIHRADGKEVQADGFQFHAARDKGVLLSYIPPAWRKLQSNVTGESSGSPVVLQTLSPVTESGLPSQIVGKTSIFVNRGLSEKFAPGADSFDFRQLPKGWVVETISLTNLPANCPYVVVYRQGFGQWQFAWNSNVVKLEWGDTSCSGFMPNPVLGFPTSVYENNTQSKYALRVLLEGPRGTESVLPHR